MCTSKTHLNTKIWSSVVDVIKALLGQYVSFYIIGNFVVIVNDEYIYTN